MLLTFTISTQYDAVNRRTQMTDANTHITTTQYDWTGRITATIDAVNHRTTTTFDADNRPRASRLTQTINANAKSTTFVYDAVNRKTQETDPDGGIWTTGYDPAGNVTFTANSKPASVTISFDPINRRTLETYSDGNTHAYTYDSVGNQLTQSSSAGTYTSSYDPRNQPTLVNEPGGKSASYAYDPGNRKINMGAYGKGTFTYSYDNANRQTLITNASMHTATQTYDPVRQMIQRVQYNSVTTQTFDEVGNVTGITHKQSDGTLISQMIHTYDNVNNRLTMSESDGTLTTWSYDPVNQLSNEHRTGGLTAGFNVTHTYDPAGNRTLQNSSGVLTTFSYSNANRLVLTNAAGAMTTYTVDGAGNQTSAISSIDSNYYTWNAVGQMIGADVTAGSVSFTYNAHGQRASKTTTDGSTTGFLYDHKNLLGETDELGGDISTLYSTTTDQEFGDLIDENSSPQTPLADAQANTNAIVGADGSVLATYKYQAFGSVSAISIEGDAWASLTVDQWAGMTVNQWADLPVDLSPASMTGFGGTRQYYLDNDTNLLLLGGGTNGRYTRPGELRFTSDDPIRQASGTDNLQQYGSNDPISNQDPSGHDTLPPKLSPTEVRNKLWNGEQVVQTSGGYDFNGFALPPASGLEQKDVPAEEFDTYPGGPIYIYTLHVVQSAAQSGATGEHWIETYTKIGTSYSDESTAGYKAAVQEYQEAIQGLATAGKEIVDTAGTFNPLVNFVTLKTGQSASGTQVSGSDRALAGASLVPADAIVGTILGVGSKLVSSIKKAREARLTRLVDLLNVADKTVDAAERAKIGETFSKLATSDELAAEAKRLYGLAKDEDTGQLNMEEALAALRLETQLGKRLVRAQGGVGEDFRIGSQTGGAIDFWGTMSKEAWKSRSFEQQIKSLQGKIKRGSGLIGVDLKNAPKETVDKIMEFYNSLTPREQGRILFIK